MKTNRIITLALLTLFALPMFFTASCIKNSDDDEKPTPPTNDTIPTVDSTAVVIDSTFRATKQFIEGEWMSQYLGFDPMQNAISAIRRLVFFATDGTYDSHVQGIANIEDTTVVEYKEFEHEYGTFSFNEQTQTVTYTVEYDSLINFNIDEMVYYPGKFRGPGMPPAKEYMERMYFSQEQEGHRDWIRTDDNLKAPDDHTAQLIYIMKTQQ